MVSPALFYRVFVILRKDVIKIKYFGKLNDPKDLVTKEYVDNNGGKVDDIKANGSSIVSNKVVDLKFNTAYNSSTNKIATMTDINNAIGSAINASY